MNFILLILTFFIIGIILYHLDKKSPSIFRVWHNIWNKEKLEDDSTIGFVFGQTLKSQIIIAVIISVLKAVMFSIATTSHPLMEILYVFVESAIIVASFKAYDLLGTLWGKKDEAIEALEDAKDFLGEKVDEAKETIEDIKTKTPFAEKTKEVETPKEELKVEKKSARDNLKDKGYL